MSKKKTTDENTSKYIQGKSTQAQDLSPEAMMASAGAEQAQDLSPEAMIAGSPVYRGF
jgi:hypothetical protein